MKKNILLALILLNLMFGLTPLVKAQEASPSAEVTNNIKEYLKKAKENSEKVKGTLEQLAQQKRGFIGQVERVTAENMTIENMKGTEVVPLNSGATILKAGKEITVDEIAIDDWAVVMGVIEINGIFTPKRILISSESLRPKDHFATLGTIVDQSNGKLTVLSRLDETLEVKVGSRTTYQDQDGSKADQKDFIDDQQIIVVGYKIDNTYQVTTIRSLVLLDAIQDEVSH